MPLGIVGRVGLCIGVLDFGGNRRRGRDRFGGEIGALYDNQWEV